MFSLIYQDKGVFGVLDEASMKYHKWQKHSFDMLVASAKEEGVAVHGVSYNEDGTYTFSPVPFTAGLNIYNCLPYVASSTVPSNLTAEQVYLMYFRQLISFSYSVSTREVLSTIGLFAYYSLRIQPDCSLEHFFVNRLISSIAGTNKDVLNALMTEPYPDDVMRKFSIQPKESKFGKRINKIFKEG